MADQVTYFNVRAVWLRLPLVVLAAAALCGAWYGVRWCVGSTMAEWAQDLETAESATRLAPADPQSHLRVARLRRVSFEPAELPEALRRRAASRRCGARRSWRPATRSRAGTSATRSCAPVGRTRPSPS
ncbi:MAG: hypothetical protein LC802_10170 [Acidobacteria bacterium]|nr:hypothetical protein [Acidobacteriota bacterium]